MQNGEPVDIVDAKSIQEMRSRMFLDFCALLEREQIRYVVLAGHASYPAAIESDVDFLVDESDLDKITRILARAGAIPGARLVQILEHETTARYFVFVIQLGSRLAYLHPDAAASVRKDGRLRLRSETALASRRMSKAGFWIPAAAVEFEYYLIKRLEKGLLIRRHLAALAALQREDPTGCASVLTEFFDDSVAVTLANRLLAEDVEWFASNALKLRARIMRSKRLEGPIARLRSTLGELARAWHRIARPTGLVIAVLGPDGSGKSTVLEHLEAELAQAFRRVRRFHLRPHFGRKGEGVVVTDPHAQPPRGWSMSTLKVLLFTIDYLWGWACSIWPARVRSTLVLFDRYFHDMTVDPARYRLTPSFAGPRHALPIIPTPDLWLVLTASPATLIARKGELTMDSAAKLVRSYESLAASLPRAVLISTEQALDAVLAQAVAIACDHLETRLQMRLAHG